MKDYNLTIKDVANKLNVTIKTIRVWIKDKNLPCIKIASTLRFNGEELEEWIKQQNENKE